MVQKAYLIRVRILFEKYVLTAAWFAKKELYIRRFHKFLWQSRVFSVGHWNRRTLDFFVLRKQVQFFVLRKY